MTQQEQWAKEDCDVAEAWCDGCDDWMPYDHNGDCVECRTWIDERYADLEERP